ncbi:MAG: enoyl-CoA hydratase/isomerase family protein [Acidobacteriota bacterium]
MQREEDLLWVTLEDPDHANALSPVMVSEITDVYAHDLRAEGVRAVLLRGSGRHFSAGADLGHLRSLRDAERGEQVKDSQRLKSLFESVLRQEALTVALVQGACVAGGCGLATANDFVIAATDSRFMYSEVRIGFVAALVATYLPLRMRGADIRELLLNPDFVSAERAHSVGLVNRVVDEEDLEKTGRALAHEVLSRASSESIARTKRLLLRIVGRPLEEAFEIAAEANADARQTEDCRRGIETFLESKKTPDWRGG